MYILYRGQIFNLASQLMVFLSHESRVTSRWTPKKKLKASLFWTIEPIPKMHHVTFPTSTSTGQKQKNKTNMFQLHYSTCFTTPNCSLKKKTMPSYKYRKTHGSKKTHPKISPFRTELRAERLSYTQNMASLPQFLGTRTCQQLRFQKGSHKNMAEVRKIPNSWLFFGELEPKETCFFSTSKNFHENWRESPPPYAHPPLGK